jgi:hypothetical protein
MKSLVPIGPRAQATALALTVLVVRLTFVAADFAKVAQW